ncbi:MAG: DsbA family protein [Candidatus Dojkabacteria bacterium]
MKNLSSTTIIVIAVVIGVVFLILISNASKPEPKPVELPVLLEEFSDFQCPACGSFFKVVETIEDEYGEKLEFVYHHFPLENIHENAFAAAVASEAAREQSKFDEYHDLLFANQTALSSDDLIEYAKQLDLDIDQFKADLENEAVIARVNADVADGNGRGVSATPTFYLEGERVVFPSGISPEEQFRTLIDELIERAETDSSSDPEDSGDTSDDTQIEVGEEEGRDGDEDGIEDDGNQESDSNNP